MPLRPALLPPRRVHCPCCGRPLPTCLCAWVRPTANNVPVQVLQHPLEAHHAKGSLVLLGLSLRRLQCQVGEHFGPGLIAGTPAGAPTQAATRWLLLYPADNLPAPPHDEPANAPAAMPATTPDAISEPSPVGLLVLDGTWRKTRKLLHTNPWLRALPRWPLQAPPPSRYALRKARRPGQLSTLEATCLALGELEGCPERYAPLLDAFDGWVADELRRHRPDIDASAG